jgi:hypothetical protein
VSGVFPFEALGQETGMLWLINRTVFHPRGYALTIALSDGKAVGWKLVGDGSEPFAFEPKDAAGEDECFRRVTALLSLDHDHD